MTPDAAVQAAAAWGGRVDRLLSHRENAVHAITLPGGPAALRLHRVGYQTPAAIWSELWWCRALSGAGIEVAQPLPALDGALTHVLEGGQVASVMAWVPGQPLGFAGVPLAADAARFHDLGMLLARLHDATDALTLPEGFTRPRWDRDGLVGETPFWGRFWEHPALTPVEADILYHARNLLRDRLPAEDAADVGLIHADVLRENVLVDGDTLRLIDFDDCGFGYRAHDLGTVLSQNLYEPQEQAFRAALIEGYQRLRPVDPALVDLCTLARCLASVGWTMPRLAADHPVHRSHIARAVMLAGRFL